jgi:hypothetical protein
MILVVIRITCLNSIKHLIVVMETRLFSLRYGLDFLNVRVDFNNELPPPRRTVCPISHLDFILIICNLYKGGKKTRFRNT